MTNTKYNTPVFKYYLNTESQSLCIDTDMRKLIRAHTCTYRGRDVVSVVHIVTHLLNAR